MAKFMFQCNYRNMRGAVLAVVIQQQCANKAHMKQALCVCCWELRPANQSRSAPIQVVWGLEKHDIMQSPGPLCENKDWNIFSSPQQTSVDDFAAHAVILSGHIQKIERECDSGSRCAERGLGGASVRPSGGMADVEDTLSVEWDSGDGSLAE